MGKEIRQLLCDSKVKVLGGVTTAMMIPKVAFADEATTTAMTTAMTGIKTDALGAISAVAPIGLGIMGVFLVWRYGIKFFKSISK